MITKVRITTNEYLRADGTAREVDQVELWIAGEVFRKDLTCERDVRMAQIIAEHFGCHFDDDRDGGLAIFSLYGDGGDS